MKHDLRKHTWPDVYRDFEGLADGKKVLEAFRQENGTWMWEEYYHEDWEQEGKDTLRSIVLNLAYEALDISDEVPSSNELHAMCWTAKEMLSCPVWTRVTDEDIQKILSSTDEEGA